MRRAAVCDDGGVGAMQCRSRPLLVQMVPMRRCNLDCSHCRGYGRTSQPGPLPETPARIDKLAAPSVSIIAISDGEPLLPPQREDISRHIRALEDTSLTRRR